MKQTDGMKVFLRHGIGEPVSIDLDATDVSTLVDMPAEGAVEYVLDRVIHPNGMVTDVRHTLQSPSCIIEVRAGDEVQVLSRKSPVSSVIRRELPDIEIEVARANRGG